MDTSPTNPHVTGLDGTDDGFQVTSRTRVGLTHTVHVLDGTCTCEAGQRGIACWHLDFCRAVSYWRRYENRQQRWGARAATRVTKTTGTAVITNRRDGGTPPPSVLRKERAQSMSTHDDSGQGADKQRDAGTQNPTTASLQRIDGWLGQLAGETDRARQSAAFTAYLTAMARFWRYSQANTALIWLQRPTATMVNSKKRWAGLGYRLKAGAWTTSIHILCPHFTKTTDAETGEERETLTGFTTGYIYDLSQVEPGPDAQPLTLRWQTMGDHHGALYRLLERACAHLHVRIAFSLTLPHGLEGTSDGRGVITLNGHARIGDRAQTLAHELAHEVLHPHALRPQFTTREVECQAEAVSYCVLTALGVEVPNTPQYLALYGVSRDDLKRHAQAIHGGVKRILEAVETVSPAATHAAVPGEGDAETGNAA